MIAHTIDDENFATMISNDTTDIGIESIFRLLVNKVLSMFG